jgi:hypothetical protein
MEPIKRKTFFVFMLLISFSFLSVSYIIAEAGRLFRSINSIAEPSPKYSVVNPDAGVEEAEEVPSIETGEIVPRAEASVLEEQPNEDKESEEDKEEPTSLSYGPIHSDVTATLFWIGEDSSKDNGHISNVPSAWDDTWSKSFGGVDDPKKRNGFFPAKFSPKENPFYFALPYNDFDENGKRKKEISSLVPWFHEKSWDDNESVCKNRWAKVMKGDKAVYAQWEDVGPFGEDDHHYVFGGSKPKSNTNEHAGIDLSPAATDYLGLSGEEKVSWQFVAESDVPDGPWKHVVTSSRIRWN